MRMKKRIPNKEARVQDNLQLNLFEHKQGFFGYGCAKSLIENLSPAQQWTAYGDETPKLKGFAVKISNLTCSSSTCERNWSTYTLTKERLCNGWKKNLGERTFQTNINMTLLELQMMMIEGMALLINISVGHLLPMIAYSTH
ncbi:hypothetical protein Ddye_021135 [Dipteronia dyeriana]|uniref:HAT C-terminal dimerisation domain-containing protein n=1 Tax=Dipteronia dyeriana TaxID=168575 RepID=A0AAD9U234_9ROSI|nr:hypothetical protein Ddye_021135 [Dipteronia dyeriana]